MNCLALGFFWGCAVLSFIAAAYMVYMQIKDERSYNRMLRDQSRRK